MTAYPFPALVADGVSADLGNWTGLGVGGVLLVLIFRTLWKFSGDSSELAKNYDAALDRAQEDATAARLEAKAARLDAAAARAETYECERRSLDLEARLRAEIAELRDAIVRDGTERTRKTDRTPRNEETPT